MAASRARRERSGAVSRDPSATIAPRPPPMNAAVGDRPGIDATSLEVDWLSPSADLFDFAQSMMDPPAGFSFIEDIYLPDFGGSFAPENALHERSTDVHSPHSPGSPPAPAESPQQSLVTNVDEEYSLLLQATPILDPVENGPIGASLRALFDSMASSSPMVRYAMAAFAAIQFYTRGKQVDYQKYYDKAAHELSERFKRPGGSLTSNSNELRYVLTTIFFLTYVNFLTGRLDLAYLNLAKAHKALQTSGRGALGSLEQRIISWIRWSDARAALTGGEGLLVNDTSGIYPSSPSPPPDSGPHEVIYDMLCQPGIAFFQEVQTITGRIAKIAHGHRSRGSVEDETEVMAIAAGILKDLSSLYESRPALMEHAVSGNISSDTLAEPLASAIVRSYRTYLANFYVCYIHLHRVAHRHLDRSKAVDTALCKIKEIVHLMVNKDESIPVNMLWPLFLWGSEEDDYDECQWLLETIRSLQHVASNANMTADVLQEIQRRQREAGARVDIRSVCLELFNVTFAII
ncbi:hypothetical protein V495_01232 [Pseudogymnoascus sp. VKM F-4514 (FW-929)]|nr:hypothetical protein V495_01232 [Pseudogymnoascus sp. VKM F-4514 (FW-929)]KFY59567.1 hypothetical protein V497_04197 [Pseudogymnoascus sp. VKM F-4516 (FW-969)]